MHGVTSEGDGNFSAAEVTHAQGFGGSGSAVGTGGMATKLRAAAQAVEVGAHCVITSGRVPGRLRQVLSGEDVGTLFLRKEARRAARSAHGGRPAPEARRASSE